jgi:hypothetical protein
VIVFAAGMRRSGSTLVFNIARELVEVSNMGFALTLGDTKKEVISKYFDKPYYVVAKGHALSPDYKSQTSNIIALMTIRDIREVCCSIIRLGLREFNNCIPLLDSYIDEQQTWNRVPRMYFNKYENWVGDIESETKNIATFLDIQIDDALVADIASSWSLENSKKKSEYTAGTHHINFLNRNHITSGAIKTWDTYLTAQQVEQLTYRYQWWLQKYDYPC